MTDDTKELDAGQVDAEVAARTEADQREAEERAKLAAHPHTQLNKILADLRAPVAISGDSATKHAHLHAAVVRLTQVILSHTPPPEELHG